MMRTTVRARADSVRPNTVEYAWPWMVEALSEGSACFR